MLLPQMNEIPAQHDMIDVFGGYDHNIRAGENTFYEMVNMSSDDYPTLSPRKQRGTYINGIEPHGIIAKDSLCYIDGSYFCMDEYRIDLGLSTASSMCPKQLVSMGAYVIILPDKKYINTANMEDHGNIEADFTTVEGGPVTFSLAKLDASDIQVQYVSPTQPEDPGNMAYWVDTSTTPHALKVWSTSTEMWNTVGTTYIKITSPGLGANFSQYDGINISGLAGVELHDYTTDTAIDDTSQLSALEGSAIVWDKGDDWLLVVGILDQTRSIKEQVTFSRKMPEMDFVVESENRLWGCRYGLNSKGEVVNELYASKLGDFKNWSCYMGTSTDSYAASVGTDGQFTGAITHLGYPIFFKENFMHKVYGNYPANFQIQTTACRGVQKGSWRSLAIVNEVLYYQSRHGICAYDGSLPSKVSDAFGEVKYQYGVAGSHDNKYFLSTEDMDGNHHFFVYDTARGMWHREDDTNVEMFASCRGDMFFYTVNGTEIRDVYGTGTADEDPVEWMAQTNIIGARFTNRYTSSSAIANKMTISHLTVRMQLALGSEVEFFAQYDSEGPWEPLFTMIGTTLRSFSIPVRPRRCDHLRLRILGVGPCKIFSIAKVVEEGSDI